MTSLPSSPDVPPRSAARSKRVRIVFPTDRHWEYESRDGVTVSAYGIPAAFRTAFLQTLLGARECYRGLFGGELLCRVEMNVRKSPGLPLRLWTNGADRVYLTLNRKSQLDEPPRSGVRYLHGLPHELGHIVLYRSLINLSLLDEGWGEGWAVYLSSFLAVPYLYSTHGEGLWPYPYDYLNTEGPVPLYRQITSSPPGQLSPTYSAVATLHKLEQKLGREGFGRFFAELLASPIRSDEFAKLISAEAGPLGSGRRGNRTRPLDNRR